MKKIISLFSLSLLFQLNTIAQNTGANNGWEKEKVKEFVTKAAHSSMLEVLLGNLAAEKASSQKVKDFAELRVKDHTNANQKLKAAVRNMQFEIPETLSKENQRKVDNLTGKSGNNFDEAYMDLMEELHQSDIEDFKEAGNNITDPDLKGWIDNTLPVLEQHLEKVEETQKQIE